MNVLSVKIVKNYIYSVILSDASGDISFVKQDRTTIPPNLDVANLMGFVKTAGDNLLNGLDELPNKAIFYKPTSQGVLNETCIQNLMSTGVLVLCCKEKGVPCELKNKQNLGWKKLGYTSKKTTEQMIADMDSRFSALKPNADIRLAVAVGLLVF